MLVVEVDWLVEVVCDVDCDVEVLDSVTDVEVLVLDSVTVVEVDCDVVLLLLVEVVRLVD